MVRHVGRLSELAGRIAPEHAALALSGIDGRAAHRAPAQPSAAHFGEQLKVTACRPGEMRWLFLAALPYLVACHSALDDAMDSYADARYPTAAALFREAEPSARRLSAVDFANYALYRGLTHLALGDARAAARWLGYAKQRADRDPTLFDDRERGALLAAWRSMGHMPGEPNGT
jgi:hypothetical protein